MTKQYRGRRWAVTINNPTSLQTRHVKELAENGHKKINYIIGQLEKGLEKTPHWQIYIETDRLGIGEHSTKRSTGVKGILKANQAHIELAKKSALANKRYCMKSKTGVSKFYYEWGTPKKQGTRTDVKDMKDLIIKGKIESVKDLLENYKFPLNMLKIYGKIISLYQPKRFWFMKIILIIGPSHYKKTTFAYKQWNLRERETFEIQGQQKDRTWWWSGYSGEEYCIWDEFKCDCTYTGMLKLLNHKPWKVQTAVGIQEQFRSKTIIFTTTKPIAEWYTGVSDRSELINRLNYADVYTFTKKGHYEVQLGKPADLMDDSKEEFNCDKVTTFNKRKAKKVFNFLEGKWTEPTPSPPSVKHSQLGGGISEREIEVLFEEDNLPVKKRKRIFLVPSSDEESEEELESPLTEYIPDSPKIKKKKLTPFQDAWKNSERRKQIKKQLRKERTSKK